MALKLNKQNRTVFIQGEYRRLTPKEWALLSFLVENKGKTFTAKELYEQIWQDKPINCEKIVAVHLRHVREKIEKDPSNPVYINSSWGYGYCYKEN